LDIPIPLVPERLYLRGQHQSVTAGSTAGKCARSSHTNTFTSFLLPDSFHTNRVWKKRQAVIFHPLRAHLGEDLPVADIEHPPSEEIEISRWTISLRGPVAVRIELQKYGRSPARGEIVTVIEHALSDKHRCGFVVSLSETCGECGLRSRKARRVFSQLSDSPRPRRGSPRASAMRRILDCLWTPDIMPISRSSASKNELDCKPIFGLYNHPVVSGADHVLGQPHGPWSTVFVVTGYRLFLIEAIGTYADLYFLCERHPRLWNRRFNSVDLKLFIQDQALLQSADAKGKRRSLMYNAVCLEVQNGNAG
jgi:hypothetical protein